MRQRCFYSHRRGNVTYHRSTQSYQENLVSTLEDLQYAGEDQLTLYMCTSGNTKYQSQENKCDASQHSRYQIQWRKLETTSPTLSTSSTFAVSSDMTEALTITRMMPFGLLNTPSTFEKFVEI